MRHACAHRLARLCVSVVSCSKSFAKTVAEEHAQGSDGTWTVAAMYPLADWSCSAVYGVTLGPDGLRMLLTCYRSDNFKIDTRLLERATRSEAFGSPQPFDGAPQGVYQMVMNDDCSRVYFSALQSVFAAELD